MRTASWTAGIVVGGWLVTMAGYLLTHLVFVPRAEASPDTTSDPAIPVEVAGFLVEAGIVGVVVGIGGALAVGRAGLGRRVAAVVAAIGPVALVTMALLLLYSYGGSSAGVLWGATAMITGTALGTYLGVGRRGS
ncbi:hypothetical protein [Halostreptopolyspora alba]|uniref:Uncharacterized protein n=1 Tax=Halostreptopolyspora alba TaxID=2487137 RepID=A0A3N0E112_9ACTN|nr:hypothetical protein EFW17_22145 [Nocardiopsaceae bacterium YIM 96095]